MRAPSLLLNLIDGTSTADGIARQPDPIGVHGQQHAILLGLKCCYHQPATSRGAQDAGADWKAEMAGKVAVG